MGRFMRTDPRPLAPPEILFPRLWIFFAMGGGGGIGRVTAENSRFVWLLLYALIGGGVVADIRRIPSVSILLSFLCPPGYL